MNRDVAQDAGGKPVLLTLDDDESLGDIMLLIGAEAGFDVTATTSPSVFTDTLKRRAPDVIVLDLQMPEADGIEMLRLLADAGTSASILLVTGMDGRTIWSAEQYGRRRGLDIAGTIQKPFKPEELLGKLRHAKATIEPLMPIDLEQAIENGELRVYYQPVAQRFADGTWDVCAVEALLRWQHPERGLLTPDSFVAMGEAHGLMQAMTDFVLQQGVEQLTGWRAQQLNLGLRVNVGGSLISDLEFPDRLYTVLAEYQIEPSALTLEVNETAMLDQHPDTFDILTRLRVKDINLAIDDFGIGYSSLTRLFRMPFSEMKIDTSIISGVPHLKENNTMVEAMVQLGHKCGLSVCAEGVESDDAMDFLNGVQCDFAQGFLIGRPSTAGMVPELIRHWSSRQLLYANCQTG